jgi:hypothetical protein
MEDLKVIILKLLQLEGTGETHAHLSLMREPRPTQEGALREEAYQNQVVEKYGNSPARPRENAAESLNS